MRASRRRRRRGFDLDAQRAGRPETSFGLLGIAERAELIGGRLAVDGAAGIGTTVEVWLPVARDAHRERAEAAPISTVIVDDHRVVREGLRAMLDGVREVEIVGEAEDGRGPSSPSPGRTPTWCCSTCAFRARAGSTSAERSASGMPECKVVFLTVYEDEQYVFEALRAGARGYMLKKATPGGLVRHPASGPAGEVVIDPSLGGQIALRAASLRTGDSWPGVQLGLTRREGDVLEQVGQGLNNRQIAEALFISEDTVKTHVRAVLRKLGVKDRAQAVSLRASQRPHDLRSRSVRTCGGRDVAEAGATASLLPENTTRGGDDLHALLLELAVQVEACGDAADVALLLGSDQRDTGAGTTRARGAADAVDVPLVVLGRIEVDHVRRCRRGRGLVRRRRSR